MGGGWPPARFKEMLASRIFKNLISIVHFFTELAPQVDFDLTNSGEIVKMH